MHIQTKKLSRAASLMENVQHCKLEITQTLLCVSHLTERKQPGPSSLLSLFFRQESKSSSEHFRKQTESKYFYLGWIGSFVLLVWPTNIQLFFLLMSFFVHTLLTSSLLLFCCSRIFFLRFEWLMPCLLLHICLLVLELVR